MKLFEMILVLVVLTLIIAPGYERFDVCVEKIRAEASNKLLLSTFYARSRAFMQQETAGPVIKCFCGEGGFSEEKCQEIIVYIDSSDHSTEKYGFLKLEKLPGEIDFNNFSCGEKLRPYFFSATGNARAGTLEWRAGERVEKIVVNNRGRIRRVH